MNKWYGLFLYCYISNILFDILIKRKGHYIKTPYIKIFTLNIIIHLTEAFGEIATMLKYKRTMNI